MYLAENEAEDIVEDEVLAAVLDEVEHLRVALRVGLVVDGELARDHDDDVLRARGARLGVERRDLVLGLLERQRRELLNDRLGALHLARFEGHHRRVAVERAERRAVGLELLVVDLDELLSKRVEVERHEREERVEESRQRNHPPYTQTWPNCTPTLASARVVSGW